MLRGERVVLRPYEREDVKRQHELMANLDLVLPAYAAWSPVPLAAREKQFDEQALEWAKGEFAIEVESRFIGFVNLHPWSVNPRSGTASFGMAILEPDYVGRGYGREALGLFLDWCFRIQNLRRIWLMTWSSNERAARCYRACGFVEEARQRQAEYADGAHVDVVTMGLLRDEWEAARRMQPAV